MTEFKASLNADEREFLNAIHWYSKAARMNKVMNLHDFTMGLISHYKVSVYNFEPNEETLKDFVKTLREEIRPSNKLKLAAYFDVKDQTISVFFVVGRETQLIKGLAYVINYLMRQNVN